MRISDWSSNVCSSDLKASASSASAPRIPAPTVAPCPRCYAEPSAHRQFPLPPLLAASNHNPLPWQRARKAVRPPAPARSEEHTSELQSLMRISYAVFCLKKKKNTYITDIP